MINGRRWAVAGLVAVIAATGTAVTAQHLAGGSDATLYLTTEPAAKAPAPTPTGAVAALPAATARTEPLAATPSAKPTPKKTTAKPRPRATKKPSSQNRTSTRKATTTASSSGSGRIRNGVTYKGTGTFYGATGAGNCSYPAGGDLMVAAMNQTDYAESAACGAYVKVSHGGKSVTVKIVDRCPECQVGDIDLSREAFTKLAAESVGKIAISWTLQSPSGLGDVRYTYKSGSSQYWCALQVRNTRNPVASLELRSGGRWRSLPRRDYNYFESTDGTGCGGTVRVTDIYGHQLTDSGISVSPGAVQSGRSQFGAP